MEETLDYFEKGNSLYNQNKYKEAIEAYDKAIEINPDDSKAWYNKGVALDKIGKNEEAIDAYNKAIEMNPEYSKAWYNKGVALINIGKNEEAIDAYNKAIEMNPDDSEAWNNKGNALFNIGKNEEAIDAYNKAIEINPEYSKAWYNKGVALDKIGKNEEAIDAYNKAIEINPEYSKAWYNKGVALDKIGKNEEAIDAYNKAIEINPEYSKAWYNKGVALDKIGKNEEAIDAYNKAIEINPDDFEAWYNKGNALFTIGKNEEAIDAYNKAIEINPDDSKAWYNKGVALDKIGKNEEAIDAYNKAIEINPDDSKVWNNKGTSLRKAGKEKEALKAYKKAFEINNKEPIIINNIERLIIQLKKNKEAAQFFTQVQKEALDILVKYPGKQGEEIASRMLDNDSFFTDIVMDDTENKESYKNIYIQSLKIIQLLHIEENDTEDRIAHYTTKSTSQALIFNESPFRLSSITTSNDPKEGKTFLDYLWPQSTPFLDKKEEEYRAFAGCFAFNHNCLNQFRLYGKDHDKECTGVSLVLNNQFFKKEIKLGTFSSKREDDTEKEEQDENSKKHSLFRCIYIEPKSGHVASIGHRDHYTFFMGKTNNQAAGFKLKKYKEKIEATLKSVRKEVKNLKTVINKFHPDKKQKVIISKLLINLRYLTKHVAFREEQECRIIQIESIKNKKNHPDTKDLIKMENEKMYIDYLPLGKYMEKIYFGPRAEGLELYQDKLMFEGFAIDCIQSDHPFIS